jgi:tetraacyldisaccharide 4'-kinase
MLAAGIANPQRFADDVRAAGWMVVGEQWFADHHPFTARDIASIATRAAERGAEAVFTTDKDTVRLEALDVPFPMFRLPITLEFDPPTVLFDRIGLLLGQPATGNRQPMAGNRDASATDHPGSRLPDAGSRGVL